jgi:predicted nucleic acid-binding protein
LRGERKALKLLKQLRDKEKCELWTGALQRAEVIFFLRPNEEEATLLLLSQFKTAPVDQVVIDKAGELYREYNLRYGIDGNDAILAAIVIQTGGNIYTLNTRHYPMPEVVVKCAWRFHAGPDGREVHPFIHRPSAIFYRGGASPTVMRFTRQY